MIFRRNTASRGNLPDAHNASDAASACAAAVAPQIAFPPLLVDHAVHRRDDDVPQAPAAPGLLTEGRDAPPSPPHTGAGRDDHGHGCVRTAARGSRRRCMAVQKRLMGRHTLNAGECDATFVGQMFGPNRHAAMVNDTHTASTAADKEYDNGASPFRWIEGGGGRWQNGPLRSSSTATALASLDFSLRPWHHMTFARDVVEDEFRVFFTSHRVSATVYTFVAALLTFGGLWWFVALAPAHQHYGNITTAAIWFVCFVLLLGFAGRQGLSFQPSGDLHPSTQHTDASTLPFSPSSPSKDQLLV